MSWLATEKRTNDCHASSNNAKEMRHKWGKELEANNAHVASGGTRVRHRTKGVQMNPPSCRLALKAISTMFVSSPLHQTAAFVCSSEQTSLSKRHTPHDTHTTMDYKRWQNGAARGTEALKIRNEKNRPKRKTNNRTFRRTYIVQT